MNLKVRVKGRNINRYVLYVVLCAMVITFYTYTLPVQVPVQLYLTLAPAYYVRYFPPLLSR